MGDDDLRSRFAELGAADRARAPRLDAMLTRAPRAAGRRVRPVALGLAGAAVAAMGWCIAAGPFSSAPSPDAMANWTAPTDVLLPAPGSGVLGEMPPLGASVLDAYLPEPNPRGN